jgi:hypothetical protein
MATVVAFAKTEVFVPCFLFHQHDFLRRDMFAGVQAQEIHAAGLAATVLIIAIPK